MEEKEMTTTESIKSEIEKLDELKRKNMITEEEYERLREEVINKNL